MEPHEHDLPGPGYDGAESAAGGAAALPAGHIDSWSDLALDLLDGVLPERQREALEAHLEACPACAAALEEQRRVSGLMRAVPQVPIPEALESVILDRVLGALSVAEPNRATGSPHSPNTASERIPGRRADGPGMLTRLRQLTRPRVWLPAAAFALLFGVAVTSYYQTGVGRDSETRAQTEQATMAVDSSDGSVESAASSAAASGDDQPTAQAPTTTTAGVMVSETGPDAPPGPSPSDQIESLDAGPDADPPVVWLTVTVPAGEGNDAAWVFGGLTDLPPVQPQPIPGDYPVYVALISTADVDAFAAALGISELRVFPLADSVEVLPPGLSALLEEGPAALPLLQPAAAVAREATNGWLVATDQSPPTLEDLAVLLITLAPGTG